MGITVAIAAPGNMGAAIGARLRRGGARVMTSLEGRSSASVARSEAAGMVAVGDEEFAKTDFVLSIVPPGEALPFAVRLAPVLASAARKPVYIDCNAVSPESAISIGRVIEATGTHFLDGCIIGAPPKAQDAGPVFYMSGSSKDVVGPLEQAGLIIKSLSGGIGSASALKMSYGGITKGLVALASVTALAADRYGVADALRDELATSQPQMARWLDKMVPRMFPKAYRWVAEMDEISSFLGDRPEAEIFHGIARTYERLAEDLQGGRVEIDVLAGMFHEELEK